MSEARLRELERRWKETQDVEDEVRYLRERVRLEDVSSEELDLAALCGYAAAVEIVGDPREGADISTRMAVIEEVSPEAVMRVRLAVARRVAVDWAAGCDEGPALDPLIDATAEQVACPCRRHAREVELAIQAFASELELVHVSRLPQRHAQAMVRIVLGSACASAGLKPYRFSLPAGFNWGGSLNASETLAFVMACLRIITDDELLEIAAGAVAPWALGYVDP